MRKPSTRSLNGILASLLVLVLCGGSLALFGPGLERIERYQRELRERSERAETWAQQRSFFRNPSDEMRATRRARWATLLERVEEADGQAALIAQVAARLQAPSVRGLEIEAGAADAPMEKLESHPATRLDAPEGSESIDLVTLPIRVSFRASYADALALLARIEQRQITARLESLDMKREFPGVAVNLALTWYLRRPQEDAG